MILCEGCIEIKDSPLRYTRCKQCNGWREYTEEEQSKIDCLDENGHLNKIKWGAYKKSHGVK